MGDMDNPTVNIDYQKRTCSEIMDKYQIPYTNLCIRKFAARHNMSLCDAFAYLDHNGGMQYLVDFYDIEHTLPLEDTIDTLTEICQHHCEASTTKA